ncbi:trifunctional serine/threonine-protein kinase/ATP-binding protein/sensor histidine kinase [Variovorax saccharolyticus]|uniref:trifunctional serine/threonine-protein kinase/ATP-binding protein/sensor histidine kinase n=1 Tax=Variovorax saccharolyticus TaxID=3053516 RepID=UPI0025763F14|nr:AAA family ATPase [Variovorax sp. J22R187]MDM0022316.1 AAA family ATPase [Variovorax sp. J22R187]MDM0028872.1 AAA family ATPase [Variovorax sp. J31P216]
MTAPPPFRAVDNDVGAQVLRKDAERAFCQLDRAGKRYAFIPATAFDERPSPESLARIVHEFGLREHLDGAWALRPLELVREGGQVLMVVDYPGGEWLDRLVGSPIEMGRFLRIAVSLAGAIGRVHGSGLIHKDIKPAHVLVNSETDQVWLTGFGIASPLRRERQLPEAPEYIAGTLAYMSPEQTGRMNRSIDSRSDLYALGVLLYELQTGNLPFAATDAMDWVHCHIARQPVPPIHRLHTIPSAVSAITMKLLAKTAEERYQTAAAVECDLRRCFGEWQATGRIADFELGQHDTPDRLMIPEKLYGRQSDIKTLLSAFDRTLAGGRPELVLVSGHSGIGKSALVNELHKPLVPPRGLFASGKFDQYKRDVPYATLAQAFQSLVRPLLSKSEGELHAWRQALKEAVEPNGLLIVDLVPELEHILGRQPPVPELPQQDAQRRFQLVFRRFIGVFARPEHPLALFLDDLQWLDEATLDLLEDLLSRTDLQHLLLIGAYRDNEVSALHPLKRTLERVRQSGASTHDIVLAPLAQADLEQLLVDSLHCAPHGATPLAQLILEKTSGNPFFTVQFILTLADEGLLTFDYDQVQWSWDLARIHAKGYTDVVAELMIGKLSRLPELVLDVLKQFACLGDRAELSLLQTVCQVTVEQLQGQLLDAAKAGLILRSGNSYRFLHDRVQEAAYLLIPANARARAHLRIGRLLAEHTPPDKQEECIFEIVNQLNRGIHLVTAPDDRMHVAALNLRAARRAKASTAYGSALAYLHAGAAALEDTSGDSDYPLVFAIESLTAECELLTAGLASAEKRLAALAGRAATRHDFATVARLRLTLYTAQDRGDRCVEVFLDYLRRCGTDWSPHPTDEEVMREYQRIWTLVGDRRIEDLVALPLMTDPDVLDMLDVCSEIVTPAFFYDENLSSRILCRMVNLSLEYGNCDVSCFGYVFFATFAGPRFGNYRDGYRFGQLGYDLVEQRGLRRYQARTYISFGNMVIPWAKHAGSGRDLIRRAFDTAYRMGDLTFAAYSWHALITNCLATGEALAEVHSDADNGIAFARSAGFGMAVDLCSAQLALIRTLRGLTPEFGCFNDEEFNEREAEHHLISNPALSLAEFFYRTRKLQARYLAGHHEAAVHASLRAQELLWTAPSQLETADFRFFGALAHAAAWDAAPAHQKGQQLAALIDHHAQLEIWAANCPVNFDCRTALAAAEIARIEDRPLDAERLYEAAIRSAHLHGFVHIEAVAHEVAARFYAARGFDKFARTYLQEARQCYLQWGAEGKARQLDQLYPSLRADTQASDSTRTIQTPIDALDLATVIRVSQTISSEILLSKLIDTLVRTAIEHAGAERGLLILPHADTYRIEAQATTGADEVHVDLQQSSIGIADLPQSVLQYVLRTKEKLLLRDASAEHPHAADDYILRRRTRSVLCLPLLRQARLLGVLYLENDLTVGAFTAARMALIEVLASEAAISLENAHLYRDLQEREARVRRLFNSNIIGIFTWNLDGRIIDANQAFAQTIGYSIDDLTSGRIRWKDLMPPEWDEGDDQIMTTLLASRAVPPFEGEYVRKDASRVPVLIGAALFDGTPTEGVAFVLDLTDRKNAEQAALDSERRYHDVEIQLFDANRVASIGQLSASIAHELNQPLAGIITNAGTGLRMLDADPPNIDGARETARRTLRDGKRAADVIGRLRALFSNRDMMLEPTDLNDAIREVLGMLSGDLERDGVNVRLELAEDTPSIMGVRIQLQQVILNLLRNASEAMADVHDRIRQLVIRTERDGSDGVRVSVTDAGVGLDSQNEHRIFDAFYSTKNAGMGVGLSVSRSIVERHAGRLWAERNEGYGATFRFSIPCIENARTGPP